MVSYPLAGTKAEQSLSFIRANPGCSKNSLTRHLGTSPTNSARYLDRLERAGHIEVHTDDRGHHAIWPVAA